MSIYFHHDAIFKRNIFFVFCAGLAIQEVHPERLWVQLSNNDELPGGGLILEEAKQELYAAGLPQNATIVGGGKSNF